MKVRYVLQNKHLNRIEYKVYSLEQIEHLGLSTLFPVHDYDIISRDRFTGQRYENERRVFEGDIVNQYNHDADDHTEGVVTWCDLECGWEIVGEEGTVSLYKYHKKINIGNINDK